MVPRADRARGADVLAAGPDRGPTPRAPFRLPVQYIVRADDFRGYAGTVVAGSVRPGRQGRGQRRAERRRPSTGSSAGGKDVDEATAGDAVDLTLETETDVTRGDLLVAHARGPRRATSTRARRPRSRPTWCGPARRSSRHGRSYLLLAGSLAVPAVVTAIRGRRDVVSGERDGGPHAEDERHRAWSRSATDTPGPAGPLRSSAATRAASCSSSGSAGTPSRPAWSATRCAARTTSCRTPSPSTARRAPRLKSQRPRVLWLTGLPGAGKSTIADALERQLHGWACTPTCSTATACAPA